ncbi:hypothetical protein [Actinocrispum sp. NPDC049592]|uniref:hypothetical protein n=1 Tax=Actinocrispum sp. NPDC049592 TaxID=3154835 RepID=UPI003422414C
MGWVWRAGRGWSPATAQRTLTFIAQRLRDSDTRDLAWWTIPAWIPRRPRFVLSVAANLLVIMLIVGLPVALFGGLAVGLVAGLAWLASAIVLVLMSPSGRGRAP